MKFETRMCILAITLCAAVALPVLPAARAQKQLQPHYNVTDLGTLGGTFGEAFGVNNKGWVDGAASLPGDQNQHAFLWISGLITDLGTLGGPNSNAFIGPNEEGQVVGIAETSELDPQDEDFCGFGTHHRCLPFLWKNGVMMPLPTLGGNNGAAEQINNSGQVVGFAENTTPDPTCVAPLFLQFKPVLWEKGEVHELPLLHGDSDGTAYSINDNGQAVGSSGICSNFSLFFQPDGLHALLWQQGKATDLGNLGGTTGNLAFFINNQGQVVGFSALPGNASFHAFLWEKGAMSDLGTLPGDVSSVGESINDQGHVVGLSIDANGNLRPFLWQNGVMRDLNTLIPASSPLHLLFAFDINSHGAIAGQAFDTLTGELHAHCISRLNDYNSTG
jgi:probable HAF family extracellular repeat protein